MTKYEVEEKTVEYLKTVFDPEIPVNVWDLGMIYKIDVTPHIAPSDSPKGEGNRPDGNTSPLGEDGKRHRHDLHSPQLPCCRLHP